MNKTIDSVPQLRLPAEWEDYNAVLLSWPHKNTDWEYMLADIQQTVEDIARTLVEDGLTVVMIAPDTDEPRGKMSDLPDGSILYFDVPTNDTWTRDYGVITCVDADGKPILCDFKFNGWGLKFASDKDNRVTRRMYNSRLLSGRYVNCLSFVLEGGSIESDGRGTLLTTSECLMSINRNGGEDHRQIEHYLCETLGADRVLWVNHGYLAGDDTDSHIDTLARFAPDDTILYVKCDDSGDEHYEQLQAMEEDLKSLRTAGGNPYHLIGLPMPYPIYDEDGNRLPATYANFLITPTSVLLPVYGQERVDELACQIMKIAFPNHKIHTINCCTIIQQHGSLHCMTMQLPRGVIDF